MSNPVLQESVIKSSSFNTLDGEKAMTINGTILKTCILGLFTSSTFAYTWYLIVTPIFKHTCNTIFFISLLVNISFKI